MLQTHLSLYSTATQNTWRRGLALGNAPNARILCWGYQHVGILEPTQTLKFASPPTQICVCPMAKPQREPMEYRLRWVLNANFLHWAMYISFFWCRFHSRWLPFFCVGNANSTRRKSCSQWNMGYRCLNIFKDRIL